MSSCEFDAATLNEPGRLIAYIHGFEYVIKTLAVLSRSIITVPWM